MTTETQIVAMTDPQLTNNNNNNNKNTNNNNNNNNNNDGEPKYLHKKFKKMATTEAAPVESAKKETIPNSAAAPSSEIAKKKDVGKESTRTDGSPESEGEPTESRKAGYVCPYCKLSCAKPSVLQKHIRAHTNERPYPCVPCGFAFKTKSNLYKHCRSRAHALKMEGGDASKISEDSDMSLSDSASNGTGTPPPPAASTPNSVSSVKSVKSGKIYKPKFHTALQCVNDTESSSLSSMNSIAIATTSSSSSSTSGSSGSSSSPASTSTKRNAEKVQEHIDKIITDNQAIVEAIDPRLHKLMQRQQSLVETKHADQQPLNLSAIEEATSRKRCYSESFIQEQNNGRVQNPEGSIIKDLLLKSRAANADEASAHDDESFVCPSCKIAYTSADNLEAHRRYYCKGNSPNPRRAEFQLDLDKRDNDCDNNKTGDYYGAIQPLPSPGPLLGNTRLVDAYAPPTKKSRSDSVPTSLRSLEELSKYPRPNSLQMFGGEVRILDNSGETKTMRIEPRQTNSPSNEHTVSGKCVTTETASIVVRSGLHSGGTMVHKPSGTSSNTLPPSSSSVSLPNTPKMLAPIIPNISTPNLAPTMSCYNYLEPHLNPLTNITAYNPLTLPQAGIASILHGGKVIPYVPGMPGPHTLTLAPSPAPSIEVSPSVSVAVDNAAASYKVIPGLPGLHIISQPLDLASPVNRAVHTPSVPGIPGPTSNGNGNGNGNGNSHLTNLGRPLDLANPAKDSSFRTPNSESARTQSLPSPKVPNVKCTDDATVAPSDQYRLARSTTTASTAGDTTKSEIDRHIKTNVANTKYNLVMERKDFSYPNGLDVISTDISYGKQLSMSESRKRPASWSIADLDNTKNSVDAKNDENIVTEYESSSPSSGNNHEKIQLGPSNETKPLSIETYANVYNGAKPRIDTAVPPIIIGNLDASNTDVPNKSSMELFNVNGLMMDKSDARGPKINENDTRDEETSTKFLRPTSLPLKPGTFTPKRHHGITPTANTLPLISPETPRPKKSYGQLYLNGHAYTYLGLKCSTRVFYCTLNRPQPMYVTQQHALSMYSNWKICKEAPPDLDMAHYDSRHRPSSYTVASKKQEDILTHSSQRPTTPTSPDSGLESDTQEKSRRVKIFDGGFESNEDYTYVRGRGRGRYVCEECGIRCKKPSMLKKHIRTHTDVRPYTCKHCAFSFKTKGNLTKHMKSKAHYKKCVELGVMPVPTSVCDENIDKEAIARLVAGGGNADDSSSEDDDSEGDESDESGSEEQEAAQSLLSLSQRSSNRLPGLLPVGRPTTYPYALTFPTTCVTTSIVSTCAGSSSMSLNVTTTTVIQSELSHRYYFPSSRCSVAEESRDSVIRCGTKIDDTDEIVETENRHQSSQPMDLTTKQTLQTLPALPASLVSVTHRAKPADILTPVSEPILMQTIVQTMERLPLQGREWKPDAEGHMLQAYLTERHVMDSKMKQQYRVGTINRQQQIANTDRELLNCRNVDSSGIPTVTYTDPSRMQQHSVLGTRIKCMSRQQASDEIKMEIREKIYQNNAAIERRPFDIDNEQTNADHHSLVIPNNSCTATTLSVFNSEFTRRGTTPIDRRSPNTFTATVADTNNRITCVPTKNEIDRSMLNAKEPLGTHDSRGGENLSQSPRNQENGTPTSRPPSREIRGTSQDYRTQGLQTFQEQRSTSQEFKLPSQETRPPPVINTEFKSPHVVDPRSTSPNGVHGVANETRPPSRDTRVIPGDQRSQGFQIIQPVVHESAIARHEIPRAPGDARSTERLEIKRHEMEITKQSIAESIKQTVARKMVVGGPGFRSPSPPGGNAKPQAEFLQPSSGPASNYVSVTEDGRSVCGICNKVFSKPSQLRLHINIHYFERPFRCESCAVSFRTKGHLTKHERSVSHHNKVSMTSTFGAATTSNPRPFKCTDCKIAFRIHGHLAKHLRSKMHIMKLECLGKLPFGTYAEMERSGVNLNDIDTTDCDNSLTSLQILAQKLYEKDPSKMGQWDAEMVPHQGASGGETSSDEGEPIAPHAIHQHPPSQINTDSDTSRAYHMPMLIVGDESKVMNDGRLLNSRFIQQRPDYGRHERIAVDSADDTSIVDENSHPYKCRICTISVRTINELQVHCFVEHNIESQANDSHTDLKDKDSKNSQMHLVRSDPNRRRSDDT